MEDGVKRDSGTAGKQTVDPFDLTHLRLSQDFGSIVGVKKVLHKVRVRKPYKQEFIRVRPGHEWRLETAIIELEESRDNYIVTPELRSELGHEIAPKILLTSISRQGTIFLWPIRLPGEDGRVNPWNQSALEASALAENRWIRVVSNMPEGQYDVFEATADLSDPVWPEVSFKEIVCLAFKDNLISSLDHPVLKQLRGE